jgi:hypothetical protein
VRAESSRDGARIRMGRGGHHRSLQRRGKGNDMVKGSNAWDPMHLSHHSIEVVGLTIGLKKPSDGSHAWDPIHLSHRWRAAVVAGRNRSRRSTAPALIYSNVDYIYCTFNIQTRAEFSPCIGLCDARQPRELSTQTAKSASFP